ncbi:MAG: type II toxin-antitoxin system HicA family toxin [Patescibacteria group bacterium]
MAPKLPVLKPTVVVKALLRADFYIHHQSGSHIQLRHNLRLHLRVTVPFHSRFDLPPFVILSILKQSELTREQLLSLIK